MLVTNCRFYLHNISSIRGLASLEYYPNKTAAAMGAKQLYRSIEELETQQLMNFKPSKPPLGSFDDF